MRCTRTATSILRAGVNAISPSTPAVVRPALRWVTWRTLTSVFDQDRSNIFCSDRTLAQSCSCVALKILRRSRRTRPSWARQSMASQSGASSSGPFTFRAPVATAGVEKEYPVMCPTCPSVPEVTCVSPSKAHLPTSATFSGPAHRSGIRPVIHGRPLGGVAVSPVVSCRLSATGICFLGILFPPKGVGLPYGRLTPPNSGGDPAGFPRSTRTRIDRGGCPLYPGTVVLSRLDALHQPAPAAFSSGQSCTPLKPSHLTGVALTRHQRGFTCFTRPVFPSPVAPGRDGDPWASPWASDPAVTHDARQDRDEP